MKETTVSKLRGRMAETGIRRQDVAILLGYSETMFSLLINGKRPAPEGFQARIHAALDRLERAERAAQKERERVLAEAE